jgi:hypothetical protein
MSARRSRLQFSQLTHGRPMGSMSTVLVTVRAAWLAPMRRRAALALALVSLLVGAGWAITAGHTTTLLLIAAACTMCLMAITRRGAFVGVLVLGAMNGVPYINMSRSLVSKISLEEVAVFVLLLTAGIWILSEGSNQPTRAGRLIARAGILLLMWWVLIVALTTANQGVSIIPAASFGRDFGFFAGLLILLPHVRLHARDIRDLLYVLTAGVCVFALGQIMIATGTGQPGSLIHFRYTLAESGVTRVYASMTDLVTAGLAISIAGFLLARRTKMRLMASVVVLLLVTSTVLQLTRARWIGVMVGLLIVSGWFMMKHDTYISPILRRRWARLVGALLVVGIIVLLVAPAILSGGTIIHRLLSIFSEVPKGGSEVDLRENITKTMTRYLGEKWPVGLGFVPPTAHYFPGLPEGSIRDSDVGALNAVMTMGVVGAVLVYLPVVSALALWLRRGSALRTAPYGWLCYGGAMWIVGTLVSSITLITLFSPGGLVLTAVILTAMTHHSAFKLLPQKDRAYYMDARAPYRISAPASVK